MLLSTVIHKYINKSNYYSTAEAPRSCVRLSSENPGVGALYPVHRVDKQVSGQRAPVCAKQCHHGMCT